MKGLEGLKDRHEALTQSVEMLTADIHAMQRENRYFRDAVMAGLAQFIRKLDGGEQPHGEA